MSVLHLPFFVFWFLTLYRHYAYTYTYDQANPSAAAEEVHAQAGAHIAYEKHESQLSAALDVVLPPNAKRDGFYVYRDRITTRARVSLAGHGFNHTIVVGTGPVFCTVSELVLWCYAECACASPAAVRPQKCHPRGVCLTPAGDPAHVEFDHAGSALSFDVSFAIKPRPRVPKATDKAWRCSSESLTLTYYLCDYLGRPIAQCAMGPFRARSHAKVHP